jgi:hypothetical protein
LIAQLSAAVALELTGYSRWRAIHSCRDLADCFPGLAKLGKRAPLFKRKLFIVSSYCNTLYKKCCTLFVNLGSPLCGRRPLIGILQYPHERLDVFGREGRKTPAG